MFTDIEAVVRDKAESISEEQTEPTVINIRQPNLGVGRDLFQQSYWSTATL